jgi:hypothetical protein
MKRFLLVTSFLAGAAALASPAKADLIFNLTTTNDAQLGSGPFATVDLHWNSTTSATVNFVALSGYEMLDGTTAAVNTNGAATISNIVGIAAAGAAQATYTAVNSSQNVDGLGSFSNAIDSSDGWGSRTHSITFGLTAGVGVSWADQFSVLALNADSLSAAAHVGTTANNGGFTGFVGGHPGGTPAPEPISLALFGTGLIGLALVRRKRV